MFGSFRVIRPLPVHDETVFVAAWLERQFDSPFSVPVSNQSVGPGIPSVEGARNEDLASCGVQIFHPDLSR